MTLEQKLDMHVYIENRIDKTNKIYIILGILGGGDGPQPPQLAPLKQEPVSTNVFLLCCSSIIQTQQQNKQLQQHHHDDQNQFTMIIEWLTRCSLTHQWVVFI